jgi:hypothetical protein
VEEFIRCSFGIYKRKQGDVSSGNERTNALKWKGVITEISTRFSPDPLGFVNDGQLRWTAADLATYQSLPFLGMPYFSSTYCLPLFRKKNSVTRQQIFVREFYKQGEK